MKDTGAIWESSVEQQQQLPRLDSRFDDPAVFRSDATRIQTLPDLVLKRTYLIPNKSASLNGGIFDSVSDARPTPRIESIKPSAMIAMHPFYDYKTTTIR